MSEDDELKGSFLFDVLIAESLGGGGLSGAPLGGGCRAGVILPFIGLKANMKALSQCLINIRFCFVLIHTCTCMHTHTEFSASVIQFTETCKICYFEQVAAALNVVLLEEMP